jgi:hypothetical protein
MGTGGREAGVAVDEQRRAVPERPPHRWHDRLRPPRPLVNVVAELGADAELEGVEAVGVAQPHEARRLVLWADVALHRGGVGAQLAGRAAEKRTHRLALALALQVPQRRVEPAHRPEQIGAGELQLLLGDAVDDRLDVAVVRAERPRRHLPVHDEGGDVGVVGGHLPPALGAVLRRDAQEGDVARREGLDRLDLHGSRSRAAAGSVGPPHPRRSSDETPPKWSRRKVHFR